MTFRTPASDASAGGAGDDVVGADDETAHSHQGGGVAATLDHGQGSLLLQTSSPQNGGTLARIDRPPSYTPEFTTPHTSTRGATNPRGADPGHSAACAFVRPVW